MKRTIKESQLRSLIRKEIKKQLNEEQTSQINERILIKQNIQKGLQDLAKGDGDIAFLAQAILEVIKEGDSGDPTKFI